MLSRSEDGLSIPALSLPTLSGFISVTIGLWASYSVFCITDISLSNIRNKVNVIRKNVMIEDLKTTSNTFKNLKKWKNIVNRIKVHLLPFAKLLHAEWENGLFNRFTLPFRILERCSEYTLFRLLKRSFNGTHNIHSLYTAFLRHYLDLLRQDITTNNIHKWCEQNKDIQIKRSSWKRGNAVTRRKQISCALKDEISKTPVL